MAATATLLPRGLLSASGKALAALAFVLGVGGMLVCAVAYFSAFLFLQGLEPAIFPPLDSVSATLQELEPAADSLSSAALSASGAMGSLSGAFAAYSDATGKVSATLSGISGIPPFSLNKDFPAAAGKLNDASAFFSNASLSLNESANSTSAISDAAAGLSGRIASAKAAIESSKSAFRSALGILHVALFLSALCAEMLFLSVSLASLSVLVSHLSMQEGGAKGRGKDARRPASWLESLGTHPDSPLDSDLFGGGKKPSKSSERKKK